MTSLRRAIETRLWPAIAVFGHWLSGAGRLGNLIVGRDPSPDAHPQRSRHFRLDSGRLRTSGPIRSWAELESRRALRAQNLAFVKAAAIAKFGGRRQLGKNWMYSANEVLDGLCPATAIANDYVKEHVLAALEISSP